jgi:ABC-type bacteriocin/lantibiotic exporter with double-glycine peptidase domain
VPQKLLTVPHIQQQHKADCLAACAAMILAYIDVTVSYSRLLRILNVQTFGTPGRNLHRLSQVGVDVVYRAGAMSILEEIIATSRPCISLVRTEFLPYTTDHAVVVVGIEDDDILLNDPAFAQHPVRVTKLEFELAWMEFDYRYCMLTTDSTPRA